MLLRSFKTLWVVSLLTACSHAKIKVDESCDIYAPDDAPAVLACHDRYGKDTVRPIKEAAKTHACFPIENIAQCLDVKVKEE